MSNLSAHQNWQSLGAGGMFGTNTAYGGGGGGMGPVSRSDLDSARMGTGKVPSAEYPDGYLGTIRSRRDDKGKPYATSDAVLDSLKARVNQKSYQRGVHKGERIDPGDYVWPTSWNDTLGIQNQLVGRKTSPTGLLSKPTKLVNDGKAGGIPNKVPTLINSRRVDQFARLRPRWV